MRLQRTARLFLLGLTGALLISSGLFARETSGKVRLLPLRVSSNRLGADELAKLTEVVLLKLKKYPAYDVQKTPNDDPMDMMVDAGCLDFNAECLAGLGANAGVAKVLYSEVSEDGGRFRVQISLVDVESGESITPEGGAGVRDNLNEFLATALEKVLGPEPVPETVLAKVDLTTEPSGAEVYLDKDFVGISPVTLRLKKGEYTVRFSRVGYEETLLPLSVEPGKTVSKGMTLQKIQVAVPVGPVPVKERTVEKKPYYKTWWFWTTISAVVVAGTVTGAVLGTRGGGGADGSARFTMDPSYAPMDVTLYPTQ